MLSVLKYVKDVVWVHLSESNQGPWAHGEPQHKVRCESSRCNREAPTDSAHAQVGVELDAYILRQNRGKGAEVETLPKRRRVLWSQQDAASSSLSLHPSGNDRGHSEGRLIDVIRSVKTWGATTLTLWTHTRQDRLKLWSNHLLQQIVWNSFFMDCCTKCWWSKNQKTSPVSFQAYSVSLP